MREGFLLTVGASLLTVELFRLQTVLTLGAQTNMPTTSKKLQLSKNISDCK